jgi:hypothetical protein
MSEIRSEGKPHPSLREALGFRVFQFSTSGSIAHVFVDVMISIHRPAVFTNPVHLDIKPAARTSDRGQVTRCSFSRSALSPRHFSSRRDGSGNTVWAARAFSWLLYPVTAVAEERLRILRSDGGDSPRDGRFQLIEQAGFRCSQELFQLGPGLLDGIEIGRVGR